MDEEFLKEHPSLKGKIITNYAREYATGVKRVKIEDIHQTQLDKAVVEEVIEECKERKIGRWAGTELCVIEECLENLKQKLGLK